MIVQDCQVAGIEVRLEARPFFSDLKQSDDGVGDGAPGRTPAPNSHADLDYYLEVG